MVFGGKKYFAQYEKVVPSMKKRVTDWKCQTMMSQMKTVPKPT